MVKQKVLLTGATGSMGGEALKELLRRRDRYDVVVFVLPTPSDRKKIKPYEQTPGLTVVWGDLANPADVDKAVQGVDFVLHPAAFIAPAADHNPALARRCNYVGTVNIINAIKKQPGGAERIRLVAVCSVAAYGDRLPPIHMARVGDPLRPSIGDFYATTKIAAERAVIESGLRYWASMRQTYIAIPNTWSLMDPIMFHQPLNTPIELITSEDAGYGLVQTLDAPEEFYGRVYNMGGGPSCRVVYLDYMERTMPIFGLGDCRKVMDRNWFGLRNFHCCWYEDSDVLNRYLGHWRHSYEDHIRQIEQTVPPLMKWGGKLGPSFIVRQYLKRLADPYIWIKNNEAEKIRAFFGSREAWERIGGWDGYDAHKGYDAPLPPHVLPDDVGELAKTRGGECLERNPIDEIGRLRWRCARGHEFDATERLIRAGHWCPECAAPPWDYDTLAKSDPALARFYYVNHGRDEYQKVEYLYCPNE